MTITIADGRGALWQWDTGRRVKITDGDGVKQVHYQNRCFGRSVDVDVGDDGTAIIPDELLQDYHTLTAYAYVTDDKGGYTKVQQDFAVYKRPKPSDYVYTPTEHAGFDRLRSEIGDLDDLTTGNKSTIVAAINEAVLYTPQILTDSQKKQARENIDAASSDFVINGTLNDDALALDKTYAQIQEAVQAGKSAVLKVEVYGIDFVLPLIGENSSGYLFTTAATVFPTVTKQFTAMVGASGTAWNTEQVASYDSDGNLVQIPMDRDPSQPMEIATKQYVDASGVPSVTAADNGKVLRVDNGAWGPVDMPEQVQSDWNQNDATQPDYVKNKPFYLEKTLVAALTKDDFTANDQGGRISYMYRSTPKLDWFVSAESIAFEIEVIDTNGRRYTATQDSIDVSFEKDHTDDGYEYFCCYSRLFDIVSGVDLDLYDDEYYYKDEWGVLVDYGGLEFSEINIKIHRVDVKKIPKICLDAAIGKTAITVGGELEDSETEMAPSVIVPDLNIPISPFGVGEEIYYDRIYGRLRVSGDLFPYKGTVSYKFPYAVPTTVGSSISFDISSEGDTLWDTVGMYSSWYHGHYLKFTLYSSYIGGGTIEFLSSGGDPSSSAVASGNSGHLYTVVFKYTNSYKTLNVTIKCVA